MRVLLKLSGEQLAGDNSRGFDIERAKWIAAEVRKAQDAGAEVVITVGAGKFVQRFRVDSCPILWPIEVPRWSHNRQTLPRVGSNLFPHQR